MRTYPIRCIECDRPILRDPESGRWFHTVLQLTGPWHYARPFRWTDESSTWSQ